MPLSWSTRRALPREKQGRKAAGHRGGTDRTLAGKQRALRAPRAGTCVHSGRVWCVCMDTQGNVCMAGLGRQAVGASLPGQPRSCPRGRGGEGANSAQELPHRLYHLPDPDSRQMRVSPSGPNNSRCVLITGRPRQEGRVERRVGVARRNEGGSSVEKAQEVPRGVWARRGQGEAWSRIVFGEGAAESVREGTGEEVSQAPAGGWALALGVTGTREGFPAGQKDLHLSGSWEVPSSPVRRPGGVVIRELNQPFQEGQREMETGGGEIQRMFRKRLGKNTGPLVLVFCLQHQEWPVRRQESRPLPRRAHQSVPDGGQDRKRRNSNILSPSLCWDQLPGV